MWWLLACTGNTGSAPVADSFTGETTFTVVKPEPLEPEEVLLHFLGLSVILEDGYGVLAAADDQGAYDLVLRLPGYDGPGTYTPDLVRYRKGQQHLLDDGALCEVVVEEDSGSFWCEGLTEDGVEAPWSLTDGVFSDGARLELDLRGERFAADGYGVGLDLQTDLGPISHEDPGNVVVPWRGEETWLLMDDGVDGHPLDVRFRLLPETGQLTVYKTERSGVAEGVAADVTLRAETDLEVSVLDGETQIGTELTFRVWDDLLDAPDDQVFVIK